MKHPIPIEANSSRAMEAAYNSQRKYSKKGRFTFQKNTKIVDKVEILIKKKKE